MLGTRGASSDNRDPISLKIRALASKIGSVLAKTRDKSGGRAVRGNHMKFRTIHVRIGTYGKAPAKYGRNAYKVGSANHRLLVRPGWTHVGTGRGRSVYEYVSPPDGTWENNPTISLQVPTDEEIMAIALEMHKRRERQINLVEGFIVYYLPAGGVAVQTHEVIGFEPGLPWGLRLRPEPPVLRKFAEFTFGVSAAWSVDLVWEHGEDQPPTWCCRDEHVVDVQPGALE